VDCKAGSGRKKEEKSVCPLQICIVNTVAQDNNMHMLLLLPVTTKKETAGGIDLVLAFLTKFQIDPGTASASVQKKGT
jgi:hypothetical protein